MIELAQINSLELFRWIELAKNQAAMGKIWSHIPTLAAADPEWFAVHICSVSGECYRQGDTNCIFPLMSIIKSFSLLYLLNHRGGDTVFQWVGVEPSQAPFNSLAQLVADAGFPRNPMINSGAITLADKLPGLDGRERSFLFCQWLNQLAGCQLHLDELLLAEVRATRSPANLAITHYLDTHQRLENWELALDTYEQICCLSGNVEDLALLGKLLAVESGLIETQHRQIVNTVMLTCGLYEASADFAVKVGLPMKSGVSGGLLAIIPQQGAIACYSPPLDSFGNPIAGLTLVTALSGGDFQIT